MSKLDLSMLSDEDRLAVLQMIAEKAGAETEEPQPQGKRKQTRKKKEVQEEVRDTGRVGGAARRKSSGGRKGGEFDLEAHRRQRKGSKQKGVPARRGPMEFGKDVSGDDNEFYKRGFDKLHKNDVQTDLLLSGGKKVDLPKRNPIPMIDAECTKCGDIWEVRADLVYKDDDGVVGFVCEECYGK